MLVDDVRFLVEEEDMLLPAFTLKFKISDKRRTSEGND
jgi:hypothetical protein